MKKLKRKDCGDCTFNGKCLSQMLHTHDSGPNQPYCDGPEWIDGRQSKYKEVEVPPYKTGADAKVRSFAQEAARLKVSVQELKDQVRLANSVIEEIIAEERES